MKQFPFTASLVVVIVIAAMIASCDKPVAARKLTIVCSGDTFGWITPCGCASNQSGGLLRRGTRVKQLRQQNPTLYIDVGGGSSGASEYDLLKFRAIVRGEMEMGLSAHNIGTSEAMFGPEALSDLIQTAKAPFISANLADASGKAIAPAMMLADAYGSKVAIVGVISRSFSDPRWIVNDPRSTALQALRKAKGQYASAILLAYAPEEELQELARALPEFDVIIGGPTGQSIPPRLVGGVLVTSATNKGKFIVELNADATIPSTWAWSASITELNSRIPDEVGQKENLNRYLGELRAQNFLPEQTTFVPHLATKWPKEYSFAEPSTCGTCHPADVEKFKLYKHTFAHSDLAEQKMEVDPYCLRCHTTGYALPGGFRSVDQTPSMVNVTCQSCHGPSQAHADQPKTKTPWLAKEQCRSCHDHENSPEFDYDKFWKQIPHGDVKAVVAATKEANP